MILTSEQTELALTAWHASGTAIDGDVAQTIASWWYSPGAPAMVEFVTRGVITDRVALASEVAREQAAVADLPEREELDALLGWIDSGRVVWP